jgi:hypothetical protein
MLNIAGLVPRPESVPTISTNSRNHFPPIPSIHGIISNSSQFRFESIPGIEQNRTEFSGIPSKSGLTQFRNSTRFRLILFGLNSCIRGIGSIRNQLKLRELNSVPELRGIPGDQLEFIGVEFWESDGTDSAMFNIAE